MPSAGKEIVGVVVLEVASLVKSNKVFLRVSMNPNKKAIYSCKKHNPSFFLEPFFNIKIDILVLRGLLSRISTAFLEDCQIVSESRRSLT